MKGIIIIALVLLAGCTTFSSLEQLEQEALRSGDWSAVEQRERIIARSQFRAGAHCPSETVNFCNSTGGGTYCECVEPTVIRSFFDGR